MTKPAFDKYFYWHDGELYITEAAYIAGCERSATIFRDAKRYSLHGYEYIVMESDKRRSLLLYSSLKVVEQDRLCANLTCGMPAVEFACIERIKYWLRLRSSDKTFFEKHRLSDGRQLPLLTLKRCKRGCEWLYLLDEFSGKHSAERIKECFGLSKVDFKRIVVDLIKDDVDSSGKLCHDLPLSVSMLSDKLSRYRKEGGACVVSKQWGRSSNRLVLSDSDKEFLIAYYADLTHPTKSQTYDAYVARCKKLDTDFVQSSQSIGLYLSKPEVRVLWFLGRYGTRRWQVEFGNTFKLHRPKWRDSLWNGDGTKLNFYYRKPRKGKKGKTLWRLSADQQVYLVIDVCSEAILGWSIDRSENYEMQRVAYKRACEFSGAKPFQLLYDNQSGHKSGKCQTMFDAMCRVHFGTAVCRSSAKHIESIIGRFQMQVMRNFWFFTGQNVTAKKLDSKVYSELLKERKVMDFPELAELTKLLPSLVKKWNNSKHPKQNKSRLQIYYADESKNPESELLNYYDMVDIFWVTKGPTQYEKQGINLKFGDGDSRKHFTFEHQDDAGLHDNTSLVGAHFMIKYDPDNIDKDGSHIRLYQKRSDGDLQFICVAKSKSQFHRAVQEVDAGEVSRTKKQLDLDAVKLQTTIDDLETIRNKEGRSRDELYELYSVDNIAKGLGNDFEENEALGNIGADNIETFEKESTELVGRAGNSVSPIYPDNIEDFLEQETEYVDAVENGSEMLRRLTELESKLNRQ